MSSSSSSTPATTTTTSFTLTDSDLAQLRVDPSKFQAKAWLSSCWNQLNATTVATATNAKAETSSSFPASLSKINLALQLQAQDCTSSLDDLASQVLTRVPRSLVEIERCENEVSNLREKLQQNNKMKTGDSNTNETDDHYQQKTESLKVQVESATNKIETMQLARHRLQHCKNVLAEWNNLSKKSDEVEKKVEAFLNSSSSATTKNSNSFSVIANDIASLRRSIALIEKVEPTVVKQANARVSAIESKVQNFAESEVLSVLSKALLSSSSSASSSSLTPQQTESIQAIITIGKFPELLKKSFTSLGESRRAKYINELEKQQQQQASSSSAQHLVRKIYHSIVKALSQDFESVSNILPSTKNKDENNNSNNKATSNDADTVSTILHTNIFESALLITENPKFTSLVSNLLSSKMKVDEALNCGSKIVAEASESSTATRTTTTSSIAALPSSLQNKLLFSIKAPFSGSIQKLEAFEKEFVFSKLSSQTLSSSSWSAYLDVFGNLSDAIVTSAGRCGKEWKILLPVDLSEKIAKQIWSRALSEWSKNFISLVQSEIPTTSQQTSKTSKGSNNNTTSITSTEALLKILLEVNDAAKTLPERAANLENVLEQQLVSNTTNTASTMENQHQHQSSSSSSAPATTSSSNTTQKELIKEGIAEVSSIEVKVKDLFLQQLMLPALNLMTEFVAKSDFLSSSSSSENSNNKNYTTTTNNNTNTDSSSMPSEEIRSLGAWLMELPMLLESIGADTAKWTNVAVEALVDKFVSSINQRLTMGSSNNNKMSNTTADTFAASKLQLKIDCEYFENVLQAVDDRLEISSKLKL